MTFSDMNAILQFFVPVNFVVVFENIFKNDHKNDHKVYRKALPVVFVVVLENIFRNDHKVYRKKKLQKGVHFRTSRIRSTLHSSQNVLFTHKSPPLIPPST